MAILAGKRFEHDDGRVCIEAPDGNWRHWDFDGKVLGPDEPTPDTTCDREHKEDRGQFGMPGVGSAAAVQQMGRILRNGVKPQTELAKRVELIHAPRALAHFFQRNAEYGDDNDFNLGTSGQYVDISRKVQKLKRRWWNHLPARDGEESDEVIVMELIGHLLMAMDMMEEE